MSRCDKDIEENPYLDEQGKCLAQYAREHGITTQWNSKPAEQGKKKKYFLSRERHSTCRIARCE